MHSITWLSGFAFGAAIHQFVTRSGNGLEALAFSVFLLFASRMLRPAAPASTEGAPDGK